MLPLGIIYFTLAVTGLAVGLRLALAPLVVLGHDLAFLPHDFPTAVIQIDDQHSWGGPQTLIGSLFGMIAGLVILALLMHAARGIARGHARLAKALLVQPGA